MDIEDWGWVVVAVLMVVIAIVAARWASNRSPLDCTHGDPESRPCLDCMREDAW